jgi:hypothetical protein
MSLWVAQAVSLQMNGKIREGVKEAIVFNLRFQAFAWRDCREKTKNLQLGQGSKHTYNYFFYSSTNYLK